MLNLFRTFIFAFGLGVLLFILHIIQGDAEFTKDHAFVWISAIVMYIMILAPFTFFRLLPKKDSFDKAIAIYTASWFAITAYCSTSFVILLFMVKRNWFIGKMMNLPNNWPDFINNAIQNSETIQRAASYSDTIFNVVVVIQLILFFIFMVKMYLGCVVAHQIGSVKQQETMEFSRIKMLRSESQLLAIDCGSANIAPAQKNAMMKIKDDLRYLSPTDSPEAFDYEDKMLNDVKTLRILCKQPGDVSAQVQSALDSFKSLFQARKLIYRN